MSKRHDYDFGIIGNCNYLGYIDKSANVLWQCWPRFDSSFVFGGLIDEEKGGHFFIRPVGKDYESKQYYEKNTNILVTEFKTKEGAFKVIDFAPRFEQHDRHFRPLMLVRKVELISGAPKIHVSCKPTYNYGKAKLKERLGSNHIRYMGVEEELRLTTNAPLHYVIDDKPFLLTQSRYFALSWGVPLEASIESTCESFLQKTRRYWRKWIQRSYVPNLFQEDVIRSTLALKLHYFEDTGAIIAAGTTSLPEAPGTERNWDYRYCWMRDSYYTLLAFNSTAHFSELQKYSHFIHNIAVDNDDFQPVYKINGDSNIDESILDLKGYKGNGPVRIGNQAYVQVQYDVYGQILTSLLPLYVDNRLLESDRMIATDIIEKLLHKIEDVMDKPDAGLWEFRNFKQLHCHTYLFHWAGCQAAIKIAEHQNNQALKNKAIKLRDISAKYIEKCYNPKLKCYTNAIDSDNLDASLFLLVSMNYLDPRSQKAKDHVHALKEGLSSPNGLVYRYKHDDDFGATDSSFLVCYFWYIEALAAIGDKEDAIACFKKVLSYSNHLGLFAEDLHGENFDQWGNFPQTYSHVGVINCAFRIASLLDPQLFNTRSDCFFYE